MRGFRLGRLFGIELRIDTSWLFIFVLLTWNLVAVFSQWHPDWSSVGSFVVAASASLIFFGCVVLHELAHSLVATSYGIRVRSITLFLFGGVSNIEREPTSAKIEFLTAIVGPITSLLLGAMFTLLASLLTQIPAGADVRTLDALAGLGPIATLLVWLGPINIVIGLFNLVPGFPLDGGRIFRSLLWKLTGDLRTATVWASGVGQAIGWLFIAGGIAMAFGARLPFFGTGLASGIWLAFIGWFLHGAATQASTRVALDEALAGMTVEQLMRRQGPAIGPEVTISTLVQEHLLLADDRALPVVRDRAFLGLVSVSDVRSVPPERWATTTVGSVMRRADLVRVVRLDDPLAGAFEELARRDIEQLPVLDGGVLVGMLRRQDVARWIELAWRPAVGDAPRADRRASGAHEPSEGGPIGPHAGATHTA